MAANKSSIVTAVEALPCVKRAWIEWQCVGNGIPQFLVVEIAITDPSSPGFRTQDISSVDSEVAHEIKLRPIMNFGGYRIVPDVASVPPS